MTSSAAPKARQNRAKWKQIIRAWRKSGATADAFAAACGVRARTMQWWAWFLEREASSRRTDRNRSDVGLVPVRIVETADAPTTAAAAIDASTPSAAWELRTERGSLRVFRGADDAAALAVIVEALLRRSL